MPIEWSVELPTNRSLSGVILDLEKIDQSNKMQNEVGGFSLSHKLLTAYQDHLYKIYRFGDHRRLPNFTKETQYAIAQYLIDSHLEASGPAPIDDIQYANGVSYFWPTMPVAKRVTVGNKIHEPHHSQHPSRLDGRSVAPLDEFLQAVAAHRELRRRQTESKFTRPQDSI